MQTVLLMTMLIQYLRRCPLATAMLLCLPDIVFCKYLHWRGVYGSLITKLPFSEYWQHRQTSLTCLDRTVTIEECGCERRIPVELERRGAYNDSTCSRASYERGAGQKVIELEKNLHEVWSCKITVMERAPTRAFSWLKTATTSFTFKTQ